MTKLNGVKILVVDDEEDLREIFVDEFRALGATVHHASQGQTALEILKKESIDVVFSDVKMAGGDGIALMREIGLEIDPKPLLFLCSGFSEHSSAEVRDLGVVEVFGKPFNWDKITVSVANAVALKRLS